MSDADAFVMDDVMLTSEFITSPMISGISVNLVLAVDTNFFDTDGLRGFLNGYADFYMLGSIHYYVTFLRFLIFAVPPRFRGGCNDCRHGSFRGRWQHVVRL